MYLLAQIIILHIKDALESTMKLQTEKIDSSVVIHNLNIQVLVACL